jgi:hypothetical protein
MKRTLLIAATALALSAPAVPHAHADENWYVKGSLYLSSMTSAVLADYCRGNDPLQPSCAGYIIGVFDTLVLTGKLCTYHNPSIGAEKQPIGRQEQARLSPFR